MRFDVTDDQRLLQRSTADYLAKAGSVTVVRDLAGRGVAFERDYWRRGAELGWTSLLVPESAGGGSVSGRGLIDATIVAEQLGWLCAPGPFTVANVVAAALADAAAQADAGGLVDAVSGHHDELEQIMAGTMIATWAPGTVGTARAPGAAEVTATPDGAGFRLNGTQHRVEFAAEADVLLIAASSPDGAMQLLVPRETPGVQITPATGLDLVRPFAEVRYNDVAVGAPALVGTVGAEAALERQFQLAVVLQCAQLVGTVQRVLEFTTQWMFDRYSFGRPLASYQALKHRFSDMTLWSEAAQATMAAAADAVQDRRPDAGELVSVAKSYIGQRATDIIQDCVQLHGGLGVTWEHDIHIFLRRATVDRVTWGTPSFHRRRIADLLEI